MQTNIIQTSLALCSQNNNYNNKENNTLATVLTSGLEAVTAHLSWLWFERLMLITAHNNRSFKQDTICKILLQATFKLQHHRHTQIPGAYSSTRNIAVQLLFGLSHWNSPSKQRSKSQVEWCWSSRSYTKSGNTPWAKRGGLAMKGRVISHQATPRLATWSSNQHGGWSWKKSFSGRILRSYWYWCRTGSVLFGVIRLGSTCKCSFSVCLNCQSILYFLCLLHMKFDFTSSYIFTLKP